MRILVLDGNSRAALAVTRSLGRAGHEVIVGDVRTPSLAQWSRYCSRPITYPNPVVEGPSFVDFLAAATREYEIGAVLPVADITTFQVTRHRHRLHPGCVVPFADADTIERAADKLDIVNTAERIGVPVPHTLVLEHPSDLAALQVTYPIVVKPWRSRIRTADGWRSTSVSYAANQAALVADLASRESHEYPLLLQERVSGPGIGVFALYHQGRPVALFSHRRVRERPPWGGVSVLAESTPLDLVASQHAIRLLDAIGWNGVAMVEFKQDVRDNLPKLMEINGRFWGSLQLAVDSGVDFPALLVHGIQHDSFEPQQPYRAGVRTRWFWGDVDSLRLSLLSGRRGPGGVRAGRFATLVDFGKLVGRNLHYDNPKPYDPAPWVLETRQWFRGGAKNSTAPTSRSSGNGAQAIDRLSLTARVFASLSQARIDACTWNSLLSRSESNTVFQTHQWTSSWLSAFQHIGQPKIIAVWAGDALVGIAPLVAVPRRWGAPILRFVADERADYCDFVAAERKREVVTKIVDVLGAERWSVLEFNRLPERSSTPALLQELTQERGFYPLIQEQFTCRTLMIEGHEAEATAIRDKASLRRRSNYFARVGDVSYSDFNESIDVEPHLEAFFGQHIQRWRHAGKPSLFSNPSNRILYRLLTSALSDTGWLLFSMVRIGNKPLAFHYGFDYNGRVLWYKPSFDVAHASHSPGMVMVRHLIGYALDRQRRELDFTLGDEPFKRRFTNATSKTLRVRVFRHKLDYLVARSRREAATFAGPFRR